MAISLIRIDDRIIHGQVVTRWAMERPCDGILVVNDAAAQNSVLKSALKSASPKKAFIYTFDDFLKKMEQAVESEKKYFLITKEPLTLAGLIVEQGFDPKIREINVGPQSMRQGAIHINKNCDITLQEKQAYQKLTEIGYKINFQLVPDSTLVVWER